MAVRVLGLGRAAENYLRPHSARWCLRRAHDVATAGDVSLLAELIKRHRDLIWKLYEDVFYLVSKANNPVPLVSRLLELDTCADDPWLARVHVRFLKTAAPTAAALQVVRTLCEHYARRGDLQKFLDTYGTLEHGQDPKFRANTPNLMIAAMRRAAREDHPQAENMAAELVSMLLQNGAHVDARYKADGGESAVHFAAHHNLWQCVEVLLSHGADIDLSYKGCTTRQIILNRMMEHLIDKYNCPAAAPSRPYDITCALFTALYDGDEERFHNIYLATLTQQGKYSDEDWNLICKLAPLDYIMQFALDQPKQKTSKLEFSYDDGWNTLLQLACSKNLPGAVRTLLQIDSQPDRVSSLKDPPILLAAENGYIEIVLQLVANNFVDVTVTGDFRDSILHLLARAWQNTFFEDKNEEIKNVTCLSQIFEILQKRGELDVNAANDKDETPLSIAVKSCNNYFFNQLLKKGAFLSANKHMWNEIREEDLEEMLNTTLSSEIRKGSKFVNIDFECLHLEYEIPGVPDLDIYPEMLPLFKICQSKKHKVFLTHPLITSFLDLKWFKYYSIYFTNLLFYLCFVIALTLHICFLASDDYNNARISAWFTTISCTYILAREMLQLVMSYREYFKTFENWMELFIVVTTYHLLINGLNTSVTFLILATYSEFSLLLGRHPKVATYIAMFLRVSKVNILLLALSSPIIFAFATCFTVLLRSETENPYFHNSTSSLFKTLVMITGEFEFGDIKFDVNPVLGKIIFVLFVVSIAIILMNLLNALAVNDTEAIQREAEIISLQAKVELFTKIESALLGYPMDWYINTWGNIADSRLLIALFRIRSKLKRFLTDSSVLPLNENAKFLLSVREDGKIMEKVLAENGQIVMRDNKIFNDGPKKSRILQIITKYILGVNMREIFEHSYYFAVYIERHVSKSELSNEVSDIKENLSVLKESTDSQQKMLKSVEKASVEHSTAIHVLSQDLSEIKLLAEGQRETMEILKQTLSQQTALIMNLVKEIEQLKKH